MYVQEESYMVTERLEIRLDPDRRRKLGEMSRERGVPVSELVRQMIDAAYEDVDRERRLRIVDEMAGMAVEDVPDPETLSRELATAHDLPDLY
jgi:hypothetical protein